MPNRRVIDTHVHIFDTDLFPYPWLEGAPASLRKPHLLNDYRQASQDVDLVGWIFEEVAVADELCVEEARWLIEHAASDPLFKGVIAQVLLEQGPEVSEQLDALSSTGQLRGVRRILEFQDDPQFALRPDFVAGVKLLSTYGVPFDLGTDRSRLGTIVELVQRCPDTQFVLNHMGKPGVGVGDWDPWATHIAALAALPNLTCKISGLLTESHPHNSAEQLAPYVDHVVDAFGFDRLMYGSDWPIQDAFGGLPKQLELIDELVVGASEDELTQLWSGTAARIYNLEGDFL